MFKRILNPVWAFDMEWAPDPRGGRLLHNLPDSASDEEVMATMWAKNGATPENPEPFLKPALCRIVSIAAVTRQSRKEGGPPQLHLISLPKDPADPAQNDERHVVGHFLKALGERRPMLVGYNSIAADLRALVQRGIILGLSAPEFCKRPDKPWEGADYFAKMSDWNVDLKDAITPGWGGGSPSLNEMATLSGIPGKMEVDGQQVPRMWLDKRLPEIVAYNEFDAVTTYLLFLRVSYFGGHFTDAQYQAEQEEVRRLLEREADAGRVHLRRYLAEWDRLKARVA
ncbi:MAG: hypothetical protein HQL51_16350 [Magnetococcales bacterium]|nr:hypothetical protein [Magnetococcales bacterium]